MKLQDEPSSTDVRGLVLSVDYERLPDAPAEVRWSATIRHRALGAVTSHGPTPSKARDLVKQRVAEQMESMMFGHAQKYAHQIN